MNHAAMSHRQQCHVRRSARVTVLHDSSGSRSVSYGRTTLVGCAVRVVALAYTYRTIGIVRHTRAVTIERRAPPRTFAGSAPLSPPHALALLLPTNDSLRRRRQCASASSVTASHSINNNDAEVGRPSPSWTDPHAHLVRCRARVAYDGSAFQGFQMQISSSSSPSLPHPHSPTPSTNTTATPRPRRPVLLLPRTVQGVLEEILNQRLLGHEVVRPPSTKTMSVDHDDDDDDAHPPDDAQPLPQNRAVSRQRDRARSAIGMDSVGSPSLSSARQESSAAARSSSPYVIRVTAAGRTDAGVHARGQAIHFDVPRERILPLAGLPPTPKSTTSRDPPGHERTSDDAHSILTPGMTTTALSMLERSLNRMLPPDIRIYHVQIAPRVPIVNASDTASSARAAISTATNTTTTIAMTATALALDTTPTNISAHSSATHSVQYRNWNVMHQASWKRYSYRLSLAPVLRDPVDRHTRWHPDQATIIRQNLPLLEDVLQLYVGTHDFGAFAGGIASLERDRGGQRVNTVRTVYRARLVPESRANPIRVVNDENGEHPSAEGGHEYYRIDFDLEGALYKQVRNMVGTALDVGRGRVSMEEVRRLLSAPTPSTTMPSTVRARDQNPCKPAPPQGLTLEQVVFEGDPDPFF